MNLRPGESRSRSRVMRDVRPCSLVAWAALAAVAGRTFAGRGVDGVGGRP